MSEEEQMLKVLSSETRRGIIKELSNGYRTPSDLSKILDKSKSTTVEHLEKLVNSGIVSKSVRPGRKWVFYSLTKKGESLVPSRRSNSIVFVFALMFLTLSIGVLSLYSYYTKPLVLNEVTFYEGDVLVKRIEPASGGASQEADYDEIKTIETRNIAFLMISMLAFLVFAASLGAFLYMKRKS